MNLKSKAGSSDDKIFGCLTVLTIAFLLLFPLVKSYNEMKTFNKFRGEGVPEATFTDALFSELRIEADGK
jgi:hypothetical protein